MNGSIGVANEFKEAGDTGRNRLNRQKISGGVYKMLLLSRAYINKMLLYLTMKTHTHKYGLSCVVMLC